MMVKIGNEKILVASGTRVAKANGGTKGYSYGYGEYVGSITVMMAYLEHQNHTKWIYYDKLLRWRNRKKDTRMGEQELLQLKEAIWGKLHPETQRKFHIR